MVFFQLRRSIPTTSTTTHPAPHSAILRRSLAAIRYATDNAAASASAPLSPPLSLPPAPAQTQSHCSLLASFLAYQLSLADVKFRFLISLSLSLLSSLFCSPPLQVTSHSAHWTIPRTRCMCIASMAPAWVPNTYRGVSLVWPAPRITLWWPMMPAT